MQHHKTSNWNELTDDQVAIAKAEIQGRRSAYVQAVKALGTSAGNGGIATALDTISEQMRLCGEHLQRLDEIYFNRLLNK